MTPTPPPETAPETRDEVVQYRVTVEGVQVATASQRDHAEMIASAPQFVGRNARVECRTVTTITSRSGWSPVPDDAEAER